MCVVCECVCMRVGRCGVQVFCWINMRLSCFVRSFYFDLIYSPLPLSIRVIIGQILYFSTVSFTIAEPRTFIRTIRQTLVFGQYRRSWDRSIATADYLHIMIICL